MYNQSLKLVWFYKKNKKLQAVAWKGFMSAFEETQELLLWITKIFKTGEERTT